MKLTTSPLPYLGLALGLLTGCGRDEAPSPAAEAAYSRTVTYLDSASPSQLDSTLKSPAIKALVLQNATYFTVFLQRQPDREAVIFNFLRAKLPANPVGTYSFKTRQDDTPDVSLTYRIEIPDYRSPSAGGYHVYDRTIYSPTGSLIITAYDAERRLVSGRFEVTVPNAADPFALKDDYLPRRSNLTLQGTFTNAPVQDTE